MSRTSKMSFFDAGSFTRLFFDDYELDDNIDGEVIAWAEMCPACKRKYLGILGQNRFDDGSAQGIPFIVNVDVPLSASPDIDW